MSHPVMTPSVPFGAITVYRVMMAVQAAYENISAWSVAQQVSNSLHKLSDRELADLGLIRGDIESVSRELAARR